MKPTISEQVAFFEDKGIRRVYDEQTDTWYFSVVDIVGALTNSPDPGAYWRKLKQRLKKEGLITLKEGAGITASKSDIEQNPNNYEIVEVEERLLNAVTGISGSGPAYVYLFYQSLVQAGMGQGLSETQASKLAFQTIMGGMEMLRSTGSSPEALIAAVSSKGGTTVAALNSFEADDFMGSVKRAVDAAVRRSEELSK